jgi:antitoxin MazE
MKTRIIKTDKSLFIRIPKVLFEQIGLNDEVEIEVVIDQLIIRSIKRARQGWEAAFRKMAENKGDQLLDNDELIVLNNCDVEK